MLPEERVRNVILVMAVHGDIYGVNQASIPFDESRNTLRI